MDKTITLGGQQYPIAPLALSQMRQVGPCFSHIGVGTVEGMAAQLTIIYHGMKAADPAVTMETVDNIRGATLDEIRLAVQAIGVMCGLEFKSPVKDVPEGEAAPAPAPAA